MKIGSDKNNRPTNKAPRNKTIIITPEEEKRYSKHLLTPAEKVSIETIENKILHADIFAILDFLPPQFVDLLFVDPPYNLTKNYNDTVFKEKKHNEYEAWLESWICKVDKLLKPHASIYICGDWKSSSAIFNVGSKYFIPRNRITWEREKGRGAKANWKNCAEDIWFFTKSNQYTFNLDDVKVKRKVIAPYRDESGSPKDWAEHEDGNYRITHPSNLWTDITIPFWSMPENTNHPTQKPEKLLAKVILASSNKGDLVFDPFLGSGTTVVAAKKLGRKYCGVEMDAYYCCLAQKRLRTADSDKSIQGYKNGIFWDRNTFNSQVKRETRKKP